MTKDAYAFRPEIILQVNVLSMALPSTLGG